VTCGGTLARVRRAGLIAAGAIGVLAIAGVGAWLALFRDTAEPVTVGEAVTSFRTDTETSPTATTPIPQGVYVYATTGYEKTDALTGVTHTYPARSTITVAAADCGVSLTWRVLKGRSTEWILCVTGDGWELRSQDERHTFFGRTETTTYTCENTPIWLRTKRVGTEWPVSCSTGDADEAGVAQVVAGSVLRVGDTLVPVRHVRKTTTFTGAIRGSARYEFWFHTRLGVPGRVVMISRTTNGSPVGDVHYEEDVRLTLLSVRPRR
jgi:hypothetical protein